jgi:hypothetical protein
VNLIPITLPYILKPHVTNSFLNRCCRKSLLSCNQNVYHCLHRIQK